MKEIVKIKLSDIDSFENHPFRVNNDASLNDLTNSIKENVLLNPLTVRLKEDGRYELISEQSSSKNINGELEEAQRKFDKLFEKETEYNK